MQAAALWSAIRGGVVLLVGGSFVTWVVVKGESAKIMATQLVDFLHMDREAHLPALLLKWSEKVTLQNWLLAGAVMLAYVTLHAFEAYGLWRERRWAEWLAALSGGIYLPVEAYEMTRHPGWILFGVMVGNACVVAYMAWMLWSGRKKHV